MARSQLEKQARKEARLKDRDLSGRLATVEEPLSAASEAYRILRTSLLHAQADTLPRVIVVTSPGSAEGKSTVCANLGVVLAEADKNTLIADCDLRRPVMHRVFELRETPGMTDILTERHELDGAYQEPLPGLKVLTAGARSFNPAELLGSRRFSEFLIGVRQEFDYVLVDSPPLGLVSDASVIATRSDGVLLTLDAQQTRKEAARRAVHSLRTTGANILGTVINNAKGNKEGFPVPGIKGGRRIE